MLLTDDAFSRTISFLPKACPKGLSRGAGYSRYKGNAGGFAAGVELNDGVCKAAKLVILGEKTAR